MTDNWSSSLDLCVEVDRRGSVAHGIERAIRQAIRDGRLTVGSKLPSTRGLAHDLGVARGTVVDAYEQLAAEGYIEVRQGAPSRVTWVPAADEAPSVPAAEWVPRWDLRPGLCDGSSFPRQAWVKATRTVIQRMPWDALGYGDSQGTIALRQALTAYLGRARGVHTSPEALLICAGFTQALAIVCEVLRATGAHAVAMEDPCAPRYREQVARSGLAVVGVPCDDEGIQVARMADLNVQAVIVTPAHQYPLGVTMSPARRNALTDWARRRNALIVEDDYDGEFRFDRRPVGSLQQMAADLVIYAGTASKTLAPALRLGWLALPGAVRRLAIEVKERLDRGNAVLDQLVLAELVGSGDFDRHVRRMRAGYRQRRDYFAEALARSVPWAEVTGIAAGMHAVVTLPGDAGATAVLAAARRRGMLLHPLASYWHHVGDDHPEALVIGYGTPAANAFRPSVDELTAVLAEARALPGYLALPARALPGCLALPRPARCPGVPGVRQPFTRRLLWSAWPPAKLPGMAQNQTPDSGGVTRRGLLKAGALAAAVAPAASLRRSGPGRAGLRRPGSLPNPGLPAGTDTIPQIEHIVVVMMENHSYDNHLGMLRRFDADGFRLGRGGQPLAANPYPDGRIQHAFRMPTTCQLSGQPAQDWLASHVQYDVGRLDGFVASASGPVSMGYWERADLPFYYSLASTFPVADRYFCSVLGQTYPNRRYLIAATSIGQVDDTLPALTDYPAGGTIFDRLDAHGITWKDYFTNLATPELFPPVYLKNQGTKIVPIAGFFTDAAAGTLPGFCLVEPQYGTADEENPQNIARGEAFVARVVNAVMAGPAWERTLLIWTFDEHGGYYDHVPPPRAVPPDDIPPAVPAGQSAYEGFARYGFRVPCAIVSAWARPRYVSHRLFDHASICKLVETKWNLPAMTYRDANAADMLDMLDLRRPAFRTPPPLAAPLLDTDPGALACDVSGPGVIPPPGSVTGPRG